MKNSIFNLLLKKEFMAKILKMKNSEEIRKEFSKEGVDLTEEELNSVIKTLKDMSSGLDKYPEEKIKELSEIVKNLDPRVLEAVAAGKTKEELELEATKAQMEFGTALVGSFTQVVKTSGEAYTAYQANKPQPTPPTQNIVRIGGGGGGNGKKGLGSGEYAAIAVCGVTLLGIAALYRNEIKAWLSGGKKS